MNDKELIKYLKNSIGEKGNYCYSLPIETTKATIKCIKEQNKEIERLNNIINSIDTRLIEMGIDDKMLDICEMYDVNGIELRKMIKELKGSDKE